MTDAKTSAVFGEALVSQTPVVQVSSAQAEALVSQTPTGQVSGVTAEALVSQTPTGQVSATVVEALYGLDVTVVGTYANEVSSALIGAAATTTPSTTAPGGWGTAPYGEANAPTTPAPTTPAPTTYPGVVLADLPAAYYRLDEAQGATVMVDASPNARHGIYSPSRPAQSPALAGDTGSSVVWGEAYGLVADAPFMDSASFSVEAVIRSPAQYFMNLATREPDGGSGFYIRASTVVNASVYISPNQHYRFDTLATQLMDPGMAYHVVVTWDGPTATLSAYVNGVLHNRQSDPQNAPVTLPPSTSPITLGGTSAGTSQTDEVAYYDYALTQQQAATHYAALPPLNQQIAPSQLTSGYATETDTALPAATTLVSPPQTTQGGYATSTNTAPAGTASTPTSAGGSDGGGGFGTIEYGGVGGDSTPDTALTVSGGYATETSSVLAGVGTVALPRGLAVVATLTGVGSPADATGYPAGVQAGDMAILVAGTQGAMSAGSAGWEPYRVNDNFSGNGYYGSSGTLLARKVTTTNLAEGHPGQGVTGGDPNHTAWAIMWLRNVGGTIDLTGGSSAKTAFGRGSTIEMPAMPADSVLAWISTTVYAHSSFVAGGSPLAPQAEKIQGYGHVALAAYKAAQGSYSLNVNDDSEKAVVVLPLLLSAAVGPQTIGGAVATETDVALAGDVTTTSVSQSIPGGYVSETDTVLAGTNRATWTLTAAVVTETALALTATTAARAAIAGGNPVESDTALGGTTVASAPGASTVIGGVAAELDTARAGATTSTTRVTSGTATESDTGLIGVASVVTRVQGGVAAEADLVLGGTATVEGTTILGGYAVEVCIARAGKTQNGDENNVSAPLNAVGLHEAPGAILPRLGTEQQIPLAPVYEVDRPGYVATPLPAGNLTLTLLDTELDSTPESVAATVGNGLPNESVTFTLIGPGMSRTLSSATLDATGSAIVDVALPGVPAGTYTLRVKGTSSALAAAPITVRLDALSEEPEPDSVPEPPVFVATVRWQLIDPHSGRHYLFAANPAKWTNPDKPLFLEHQPTTAPDGNLLAWQGADRSWTFEFSGVVLDQAMYQELQFWASLRRRFWLIDHRGQARYVTFAQFDAKARTVPNRPWVHDYTMRVVHFYRTATDSEEGT